MKNVKVLLVLSAVLACVGLTGCQRNYDNVQPSAGHVETHHYKDHGKFGN